jgi:hypothetical protein
MRCAIFTPSRRHIVCGGVAICNACNAQSQEPRWPAGAWPLGGAK